MTSNAYTIPLDRVANQPVSEGMHSFKITNIEEGESRENSYPMWTIRMLCLDEGPDAGKEATLWLVLIDSMRWKVEKFLDAVGAPPTGDAIASNFIGRQFRAQISHRKQDGRTLADIGEMFPMSASKSTPQVRSAQTTPVARTGVAAKATVPQKVKGLPADAISEEGATS